MEGARNAVNSQGIKEGENVAIWTDRTGKVDPLVIQAFALAIEEAGADVTLLTSKVWIPRLGERIPPIVEGALESSDVIFYIAALENAAIVDNRYVQKIRFESGVRVVEVHAETPEDLTGAWARFPVDLWSVIFRKSREMYHNDKFHLTTPNGGDLIGMVREWPTLPPAEGYTFPGIGNSGIFPYGEYATYTYPPVDGVVVVECLEGFGLMREPVKFTVENSWITKVEGGEEARWLRKVFKLYKNANHFIQFKWGLNPKVTLERGLRTKASDTILFCRAGTFHVGFGNWPTTGVHSDFHLDAGGLTCTITIGRKIIVDKGYPVVLDDPEVREVAAKYGDPEEVLAIVPY